MKIAIDATNIRAGGGLTHLKEVLSNGDPTKFGINKVLVWSNSKTLSRLESRDWLEKKTHFLLNGPAIFSFIFQIFLLSTLIKKEGIYLLFVPAGTFLGRFRNIVSMSQNMLPFEKTERGRFFHWRDRMRFKILRWTQSYTFRKSKGVVFLTNYARESIQRQVNISGRITIISHGISTSFLNFPKGQRSISEYSFERPFRFLYVSIVTVYKHQWTVIEALLRLRKEGFPIELQLIGPSIPESLRRINSAMVDDEHGIIKYSGEIPYQELSEIYKSADGFIFASSCENQPIILLESMSAGMPIACSNMGPMPEVLGDSGFYFDPLNVDSVYYSIRELLMNKDRRMEVAKSAFNRSRRYTWEDCANNTYKFLSGF